MILKSKSDYIGAAGGKIYHKVTLPHNSLFVLGWQTNRDFLHSIRSDKRLSSLKEDHELLQGQQRISLTFRTIATFVRHESSEAGDGLVITGQGARKKPIKKESLLSVSPTRTYAQNFSAAEKDKEGIKEKSSELHIMKGAQCQDIEGDDVDMDTFRSPKETVVTLEDCKEKEKKKSDGDAVAQSHLMLNGFSAENRTAQFDWDQHYGQGFDIVNFCFMNGSSGSH